MQMIVRTYSGNIVEGVWRTGGEPDVDFQPMRQVGSISFVATMTFSLFICMHACIRYSLAVADADMRDLRYAPKKSVRTFCQYF